MVTVVQTQTLTVEQFLAQYNDDNRYELIDGALFDLEPTGPHVRVASPQELQVAAFIDRKINVQIDASDLPYFILQRGILKPLENFTAFRPDVMVVDNQVID